ncbi:MAG: tRNA (adenosine(37)-N6)-dimethylallyltransferase MiaA [Actinobacteria bacterium]|nr:MAG: tRNA (adenosine(37)-N6)-dimethylallyltransferase MiaA [Actinomycetota bacterium]
MHSQHPAGDAAAPPRPRPHLVLVGPTASGKSALALELARRLPGPPVELVSVDSMQVYRGMDVGTAKPTAEQRAEFPHHLLDLADPSEDYSVAQFQAAARAALGAIEARGHRALLVGGTGLYLRAVLDGLQMPGLWPEVRAELEEDRDNHALHRRLAELDPPAAARMTPSNRRRIVRALEVSIGSGRPFSSFGPGLTEHRPSEDRMAGVWLPRPVVAARVAERVQTMVGAGLVEEVRALADRPGGLSRTARQALGYREVLAHLAGRCTLDEALEEAVRRTRAFSRRQRMWFRRDPRITWYGSASDPLAVLPVLLGDWSHP